MSGKAILPYKVDYIFLNTAKKLWFVFLIAVVFIRVFNQKASRFFCLFNVRSSQTHVLFFIVIWKFSQQQHSILIWLRGWGGSCGNNNIIIVYYNYVLSFFFQTITINVTVFLRLIHNNIFLKKNVLWHN